ncbi:Tetratricopeptide repeat-containing protein [Chryseobacterium soldanellicola]|uniref:Tetratricopeptide repeat-containing protein n=1 Tax=Chryseobacterium soldanellicola TaxID=311333 RepID=A0A1H0XU36_9FLAO|nr:TIR domain-containing protein [Chryseobacterium soldanellicola]SDQ06156.1 Tetratricopeptide repeat-containing protein [Chryseobacterium soldanellicola]
MNQSKVEKTIFISYSWQDFEVADKIENDLNCSGIKIVRDVKLEYKDNIFDFMKRIKNEDYALLLISNSYLNSVNCMREVLEIITNQQEFSKKILPVILPNTKLFKAEDRIDLIKNWEKRIEDLNIKLKSLNNLSNTEEIIKTIGDYSKIRDSIDIFTQTITQLNCKSFQELDNANYQPLLEHIGILKDDLINLIIRISQIKDLLEREIEIDKLLEKNPNQESFIFLKANIALNESKYEKAKLLFNKLLEKNKHPIIYNNLGICLQNQGLIDEAIIEYKKAIEIDTQESSLAYTNLALLQHEKYKLYDEAEKNYLKSLEYYYTCSVAHANYANLLVEMNNYSKSIFHYEEALKYYSPNESNIELYSIYYSLSFVFHTKIKNFDAAKKNYLECLRLNSENFKAHCNFAVLLIHEFKDFNQAEFHYKEALKINPKDHITLNNIGNFYMKQMDNEILAEHYYNEAIKFNNLYTQPYIGLGILNFEKDILKSKLFFEKALEIDPKFSQAHFYYAKLLSSKFNDPENAKIHYITSEILKLENQDSNIR